MIQIKHIYEICFEKRRRKLMQTGMKLAPGEIPASLMDGILLLLKETRYGQIVLVAQDRRLIQVERREKIRVKEG